MGSQAPTARSVSGAVQQREHVESELCTRGPAELAVTQGEDDDVDAEAELALPAALPAPRVEAAFHCRLRRDAEVERRTLHELSVYYLVSGAVQAGSAEIQAGPQVTDHPCTPQPDTEGAFRRGPGLNLTSGQYTAPVAGFYTLAATLHVGEVRARVGGACPAPYTRPQSDGHAHPPTALAEQPRRVSPRPRDRLRLLICIQSRCQRNA